MWSNKIITSKPLIKRINSIKLEFLDSFSEGDQAEVFSFMKSNMEKSEIIGFYFDQHVKKFIVKLTNEETVHKYIGMTFQHIYKSGRQGEVKVTLADDFVHAVKLFNVPYEINRSMLEQALERYGRILHLDYELYGDNNWTVPNGNIIIQMQIHDDIPTRISVAGFTLKLYSPSLERVCFFCGSKDHSKQQCTRDREDKTADQQTKFKCTSKNKDSKQANEMKCSNSNQSLNLTNQNSILTETNSEPIIQKILDDGNNKSELDTNEIEQSQVSLGKSKANRKTIHDFSTDDPRLKRYEDLARRCKSVRKAYKIACVDVEFKENFLEIMQDYLEHNHQDTMMYDLRKALRRRNEKLELFRLRDSDLLGKGG